jgi:osmoprotectant transport system permease protein
MPLHWTPKHLPEILTALWQHLALCLCSVGIGCLVALVLGVVCARRPKLYALVLTIADVIFVIPSLALFAMLIPLLGLGAKPTIVGLSSYTLLILLRNVVTGLRGVAPEVLDAADGMGYGTWRRLVQIELPLALPLIVAGVRVAVVTVIGIATVAAFIDAGGLGTIILMGIDQSYTEKILVGGMLTAALATFFDVMLGFVEKTLVRRQRMMP